MSKVTAKYQITIPMEVRKEIGIVPGSEVDITKEEDKYILPAGRYPDAVPVDSNIKESWIPDKNLENDE